MTTAEWLSITRQVVDALESLDIKYAICGSVASMIYGDQRTTLDCDLLADMKLEQVEAFAELLSSNFFVDADALRDAISRRSWMNVLHQKTLFKVDIFIPKQRTFDVAQLAHRKRQLADDQQELWFVSCEDIILAKLDWFRLGDEVSERQWRDVLGVLRHNPDVDVEYVRKAAAELGVEDLLEQALLAAAETDEPQLQ